MELTPRDYQQEAVNIVDQKFNEGISKQVLVLATGLGKEQPLSAHILTPWGWKTMGDMQVGSLVIGSDGKPKKVTGVYPQGFKQIYKISFSDKTTTECGIEHLWTVNTKDRIHRNQPPRVKTTRELISDMKYNNGDNKWFLPVISPIHFKKQEVPIDPYLLGCLIANGSITHTLSISLFDKETCEIVNQKLKKYDLTLQHSENYDYYLRNISHKWAHSLLRKQLKDLGLMGKKSTEKHIPPQYLYNDLKTRTELLQGLMDCDGTISPSKQTAPEYSTSSPQLAKDFLELTRSMGNCKYIRVKKEPFYRDAKGKKKICNPSYRISVSLTEVIPFKLKRKKEMYRRDYKQGQTKAINSIKLVGGENCQCIMVDTPDHLYVTNDYILTHNTVIFSHIIANRHARTGKKALILAHREELLTQAKDKLERIEPNLKIEIEMAEKYSFASANVIIASVATIGRKGSNRIQKFNPEEFDTIVIDEAHHASATTYQNVLRHFGILKEEEDWNKNCLLLGVTATPQRQDNLGLDKIFDEVVYTYGIIPGIQNGWLSRIKAYRIDTTTSLDAVHNLAGDFKQDELSDAINNPERNELIVKTYLEQFKDQQALIFAIDVAHSNALASAFVAKGILATTINGKTSKDIRAKVLEKFHDKQIHVVINCMVLTEGYDNDTIDVIMMARPTKSGILYQQMVGRGTRTHKDKPYLTIVDFVDNTYKHTIKTSASLLGIEGSINFRGTDILEGLETIEKIRELSPNYNLNRLDFDKLDYIMEEVDLMSGLDIPTDLQDTTKLSWHRYGENTYRIGLGDSRYIIVQQTITGQWKATFEKWDKLTKISTKENLGEAILLEEIVKRADTYIRHNYTDSLRLVDMSARWRKEPPSEKQILALRNLGVSEDIIAQCDKGQASQLQTKLYSTKNRMGYAQKISRWR